MKPGTKKTTYVLVAKESNKPYELVEKHIFTRKDIDNLGFSINYGKR